jgi:hypothetical protein
MDIPVINTKKAYKYNQIEFWAEHGLINIYDGRDGSTKVEPTAVMRKRAKALFEEASRAQRYDDKQKLISAARDIMLCVQEAKEQGDPTDPRVAKQLAHDNRKIWSTGASVEKGVTNSGIILG